MNDHPGYIYVVSLAPMGMPGYKIGFTKHLNQRMTQLGVPHKGTLSKWWWVNDVRACEKAIHNLFKTERVPQSEWFKISESQIDIVKRTVRKWKEGHPSDTAKPVVIPATKNVANNQPRSSKEPDLTPYKPVITTTVIEHKHIHESAPAPNISVGIITVGLIGAVLIAAAK